MRLISNIYFQGGTTYKKKKKKQNENPSFKLKKMHLVANFLSDKGYRIKYNSGKVKIAEVASRHFGLAYYGKLTKPLAESLILVAYSKLGSFVNKPKEKTKYETNKGFYESDPWRALRYKALKLHGRRCMVCGATPESGAQLHVDHIKPRSKYPELELVLDNLQILCRDCNLGKSNKDSIDWRQATKDSNVGADSSVTLESD